jgi:hypothetical protein
VRLAEFGGVRVDGVEWVVRFDGVHVSAWHWLVVQLGLYVCMYFIVLDCIVLYSTALYMYTVVYCTVSVVYYI